MMLPFSCRPSSVFLFQRFSGTFSGDIIIDASSLMAWAESEIIWRIDTPTSMPGNHRFRGIRINGALERPLGFAHRHFRQSARSRASVLRLSSQTAEASSDRLNFWRGGHFTIIY